MRLEIEKITSTFFDQLIAERWEREQKKELPEDMEFLVTNDKYQLRTVKDMIEELYTLYKREGKILDQKKENLERARKELLEAKGETKNEN